MQFRQKVVVVPCTRDPNTGELVHVMVKDTASREWGYIIGGKKASDKSFNHAAWRELQEETNSCLYKNKRKPTWKDLIEMDTYRTSYRPQELLEQDRREGIRVESYYKIFVIHIDYDPNLRKTFSRGQNSETNSIRYWGIDKNPDNTWWDFCKREIYPIIGTLHLEEYFR